MTFYQLDVRKSLNKNFCNPFQIFYSNSTYYCKLKESFISPPILHTFYFISYYFSTDGKSKASEFFSTKVTIPAETLDISANLPDVNQNLRHEADNSARSVSKLRVISLSHFFIKNWSYITILPIITCYSSMSILIFKILYETVRYQLLETSSRCAATSETHHSIAHLTTAVLYL